MLQFSNQLEKCWFFNDYKYLHVRRPEIEVVDCKQNGEECKLIFNEYAKGSTVDE